MEKVDSKLREITFMSVKNGIAVSVHTALSRVVATQLEKDDSVETYETNVTLSSLDERISPIGLRPSYFKMQWTSDFLVRRFSGAVEIIEVVDEIGLEKKSVVEKLEISRRYWNAIGINKWSVCIVKREEVAW